MEFADLQEIEKALGKGLPRVLRTLLVSDGTVTRFLEAYFQEPILIHVEKHQEQLGSSPLAIELKFCVDERILIREVELQGSLTKHCYAKARSWLRLSRLDREIQTSFQQKQWGIGELLSDRRVESYREILGFWIEGAGEQQVVARSYRIWIRSEPTILIEERFPLGSYCGESE